MTNAVTDPGACRRVCEALLRYRRVVVTSHMRPDGDSIGSSLALAWRSGRSEPTPASCTATALPFSSRTFRVSDIEIGDTVPAGTEAVAVLECGDLARTGLSASTG